MEEINYPFRETICDHREDGDDLILITIDPRQERDLVLKYGEVPRTRGEYLSEEGQESLSLY